jgi:hypothetical protein
MIWVDSMLMIDRVRRSSFETIAELGNVHP